MPGLKRKRSEIETSPNDIETRNDDGAHSDSGDSEFIRKTIEQRNVRDGTTIVKKSKGKSISKGEVGGGSFQSMGLHPSLLRALTLRGYRVPTPIQRLSIPTLLATPPRDLVGMARTGSGKTLAYMIPLIQRLGGRHSSVFGARALILLPARELAIQVLRVGKELARGWSGGSGDHAGDADDEYTSTKTSKTGEHLRWGLVVGGEGLDEQFEMIAANPDVIIATPGRLLHLIVEMNMDLRAVQYVVFDEADRLFELGFETALQEIIHKLPSNRQTLLFSATLPKSLVDFAKAGLQNPKLLRLDAESKISSDLRMAFFAVKQGEKEACLLALLREVIKVPVRSFRQDSDVQNEKANKNGGEYIMAPHQTLVFAATKHHVEYLNVLLTAAGYAVSHIYGTLDQTARSIQMDQFRRGLTNILVVTDVAARGIDIPVLENVVNYDFPQGARVFVHRVGRTARAGRKGWAWTFTTITELPFLLDLQLFLGRPLKARVNSVEADATFVESLVIGTFSRTTLDQEAEYIRALEQEASSIPTLREVMKRGHAMYERSKGKASPASYVRAKEMSKQEKWGFGSGIQEGAAVHPVLQRSEHVGKTSNLNTARVSLLNAVNNFRPSETVFELGTRGKTVGGTLMKERRKALSKAKARILPSKNVSEDDEDEADVEVGAEMANESDIEGAFGPSKRRKKFRDEEFYMSHYQKDANTEKGYSLRDGASFSEQAKHATFDLTNDDGLQSQKRKGASQLRWDRKQKKFIRGDGVGADNVKLVKTESGAKLPITYRSGRFEEWKNKSKVDMPKVGEAESSRAVGRSRFGGGGGKRFLHRKVTEAKPLDKLGKNYERKARQMQMKRQDVPDEGTSPTQKKGKGSPVKLRGRWAGKSTGKVKNELKTADQIRKQRNVLERKRSKNARPSRKSKR